MLGKGIEFFVIVIVKVMGILVFLYVCVELRFLVEVVSWSMVMVEEVWEECY